MGCAQSMMMLGLSFGARVVLAVQLPANAMSTATVAGTIAA